MTKKFNSTVLIIDDDQDILTTAELFIEENFENIFTESNPQSILPLIRNNNIDIILLDMNFRRGETDGYEGLFWLEKIKEVAPEIIVILMTAFGDIDLAVQGIKKGAFDFILKPWKNAKLLATLISANRYLESQRDKEKFKNQNSILKEEAQKDYTHIIGDSLVMKHLKESIQKVAKTDANVLILGENGTGKELAAREIHRLSDRKNEIFVSADMGAITETLFESEMFGHTKGAFTDAKADKPGRFELANKGTIFLDEIGNLSFNLQAKLLTVLQNRRVTRVGSTQEIPFDARLICATNMPLKDMIFNGKFRQDLYYRLNTFEIYIPTLQERIEDIGLLAQFFLERFKMKYKKPNLKITEKILRQLKNYDWPGNIRELKNVMERSTVLSENKSLFIDLQTHNNISKNQSNNLNLDENEKMLILKAIEKNKGNISKAAKELGVQRNTLYRKLEKYGL